MRDLIGYLSKWRGMMVRLTKDDALHLLRNVSGETCFWCNNGHVLNNLRELETAFNNMDNGVFEYHVNGEKNDFSKWVVDVIQDTKLANDLLKAKTRVTAAKKVSVRIKTLSKLLK